MNVRRYNDAIQHSCREVEEKRRKKYESEYFKNFLKMFTDVNQNRMSHLMAKVR